MILKVLGSSSRGNGYLLKGETSTLIIEAGVPFKKVKEAMNFNIDCFSGLIATHGHGDHFGKIGDYLKAGIKCYTSSGTIKESAIQHHNLIPLKAKSKYQIGEFQVMPFPVVHDAEESFGYLINHPECGLVMFLTDSAYIPFKFPGLNNIMIEANYGQQIIDDRAESGSLHQAQRHRIMKSHMSIENCIRALQANDLSKVNNIVLIHLSDGNSNALQFQQHVIEATGKNVTVADKGVEINFNREGV